MSEMHGCYFAIVALWGAALGAYALKRWNYTAVADIAMTAVLLCFTAIMLEHHIRDIDPTPKAASSELLDWHDAVVPSGGMIVTLDGDGCYHTPDCERLAGKSPLPYRGGKQPCVDCILPRVNRMAER